MKDTQELLEACTFTYERSVKDNEEDFTCLFEMFVSLMSVLKARGVLTEEEINAILEVPERKLEEKKNKKEE